MLLMSSRGSREKKARPAIGIEDGVHGALDISIRWARAEARQAIGVVM